MDVRPGFEAVVFEEPKNRLVGPDDVDEVFVWPVFVFDEDDVDDDEVFVVVVDAEFC